LVKSFPESNLYKGYLCEIAEIIEYGEGIEDSRYLLVFENSFKKDDKSRESLKRYKDFIFPGTYHYLEVLGTAFVRFTVQDLELETYFG